MISAIPIVTLNTTMKLIRRLLRFTIVFVILILLSVWISNRQVNAASTGLLYTDVNEVPHNKVGLLLGTGKYLTSGYLNRYYKNRIEAAVTLYKAGKIDFILVSGDNSRKDYDEPTTMKEDLIRNGIPEEKIYLDYAGFRTLDSVVRSKAIFGQQSITVISQAFHNQRALYIAQRKGIEAVGYNAKDVGQKYGKYTRLREKLARVKMMLDLTFGKRPKFYGDPITIK